MIRRPTSASRTVTLLPYTTLFRAKGTAFAAAGLSAGVGRSIGDLDILVPRDRIDAVEAALLGAGWEWVKPDPYDDVYYRRWMHELPPLIPRERDRMIDVHHTILRSEEHTSELQSLMRISYAVFCLKKKKKNKIQ